MAENSWVNPYFSPEVHPEIPGVTSRAPKKNWWLPSAPPLLRRSSSRRSSLASVGSRPESPCCLGMTPGISVVGTNDGWIHDVWGRNFTYTDDVTIYFFNTSVYTKIPWILWIMVDIIWKHMKLNIAAERVGGEVEVRSEYLYWPCFLVQRYEDFNRLR